MKKAFIFLVLLIITLNASGQTSGRVRQLSEVLASGNVTFTANGNGSSSGMAIKGTLRNNTSAEIRVNVVMTDGIYFTNSSSSAQNMVAVQILDFEFGYYTSGNQYYIPLSPQKTEEINLIAFCANFDRDNPSSEQTFRSSAMPPELRAISAKISRYHADHMTTTEVMVKATQIALWRIQDWTREEIELQYEVTDESWELSTVIMNY